MPSRRVTWSSVLELASPSEGSSAHEQTSDCGSSSAGLAAGLDQRPAVEQQRRDSHLAAIGLEAAQAEDVCRHDRQPSKGVQPEADLRADVAELHGLEPVSVSVAVSACVGCRGYMQVTNILPSTMGVSRDSDAAATPPEALGALSVEEDGFGLRESDGPGVGS